MDQRAGAQISKRSFIQAVVILFVLMLLAGALTLIIPAGHYARTTLDGREVIDPASFQFVPQPDYPIWRWFTAPLEVLAGPNALTLITIILFILMVGASFAVLEHSGVIKEVLGWLVTRFGARKEVLLLVIAFFFAALGAFFGIFEEIVPLVPLIIALAYQLGWDSLVGLGMSILAVNIGFSAAVANPFTTGVAQELAGLPLYSGWELRLIIFVVLYGILAIFLVRYARRIERNPQSSAVYHDDQAVRAKYARFDLTSEKNPRLGRAVTWFLICMLLVLLVLFGGRVITALSEYALPIVGVLFLIGGLGAGMIASHDRRDTFRAAWQGVTGIAPGIVLILMAASISFIVINGGILDTLLHAAAEPLSQMSPFVAALLIYGLTLLFEFVVASGSAKAFLLIPIVLPLADLIGVTRQTAVLSYIFGDGFSNLMYPTSPVLLIVLGLTVVSYGRWIKWSLRLWLIVFPLTLLFLALAVALNYGPF